MSDATTYEEELIGGVAVVSRVKDAIVTHESLEIESVLGMTLDPAVERISTLGTRTRTKRPS